jgi:hypothetical protein
MSIKARLDRLEARAPSSVAFCFCMTDEETPEEAAAAWRAAHPGRHPGVLHIVEWGESAGAQISVPDEARSK